MNDELKFFFTDSGGQKYSFNFDDGPGVIEIEVYRQHPRDQEVSATTSRPIKDGKTHWFDGDHLYLSHEAKDYCNRLVRLRAFL